MPRHSIVSNKFGISTVLFQGNISSIFQEGTVVQCRDVRESGLGLARTRTKSEILPDSPGLGLGAPDSESDESGEKSIKVFRKYKILKK